MHVPDFNGRRGVAVAQTCWVYFGEVGWRIALRRCGHYFHRLCLRRHLRISVESMEILGKLMFELGSARLDRVFYVYHLSMIMMIM